MVAIKDVSELRVYQHALRLYPEITEFINFVPFRFAKLRHQLSNSSEAIPPLIAEGYAKTVILLSLEDSWKWQWQKVMNWLLI